MPLFLKFSNAPASNNVSHIDYDIHLDFLFQIP